LASGMLSLLAVVFQRAGWTPRVRATPASAERLCGDTIDTCMHEKRRDHKLSLQAQIHTDHRAPWASLGLARAPCRFRGARCGRSAARAGKLRPSALGSGYLQLPQRTREIGPRSLGRQRQRGGEAPAGEWAAETHRNRRLCGRCVAGSGAPCQRTAAPSFGRVLRTSDI